MRTYFLVCYVAACLVFGLFVAGLGKGPHIFDDDPDFYLKKWPFYFYHLTFLVGGIWAYYLLAEELDSATRHWEWTGRILAFPVIAAVWLGASIAATYAGATIAEIGRRALFPQVPIHSHWLEYLVMVLLGLAFSFLAALALFRLLPEPNSAAK